MDGATTEDVLASRDEEMVTPRVYLKESSTELTQLGENPLAGIDFTKAEAMNNAAYAERKGKSGAKREYLLKKLFLQYAKKYALKWNAVMNYPKQIKQKPAWFDLALSMFKENEISSNDKKKINIAFNKLWEFRDRVEPERVMTEEESLRQYGINSPYYQQPEAEIGGLQPSEEVSPSEVLAQEDYFPTQPSAVVAGEEAYQPPVESSSPFGVRKITPREDDDYLSGYMTGFKSNVVKIEPFSPKPITQAPPGGTAIKPQGEVSLGLTPSAKKLGGSGGGAFDIGRQMFSSFRGGESLKNIMTPTRPALPSQPVQVVPAETITVAQQPQAMQRKRKTSASTVDRTTKKISSGLSRYRSIELPSFGKSKMSVSIKPKSKTDMNIKLGGKSKKMKGIGKVKSSFDLNSMFNQKSNKIKSSATFDKNTIGNMSSDIKNSVGGIVGGIKNLKKQVRGEFRDEKSLKALNLKNLKSNKVKTNKDLNVLNKLKMDTHAQVSREALECKMIPKLRDQCDKVFTKNKITGEVSKFRNEFKDIAKTVPTVKGDKARIKEINMVGGTIRSGVDNAQVDDVRNMYKNSGTTKQMKIGMVEYDYSFATGNKRKIKTPPLVEEYYEEVEE